MNAPVNALGALATHLANLPSWAVIVLNESGLDMASAGQAPKLSTRADILQGIPRTLPTRINKAVAELFVQLIEFFRARRQAFAARPRDRGKHCNPVVTGAVGQVWRFARCGIGTSLLTSITHAAETAY